MVTFMLHTTLSSRESLKTVQGGNAMRSVIVIGLTLGLVGCGNMVWSNKPTVPETSRTAVVHDVRVSLTEMAPTELRVNVGNEVRFLNDRSNPVRVILIEAGKAIACNKGFNGTIDQEADIRPGQYASFCFNKVGTVKYMVREQTAVAGGEQVLSAQIQVGGGASVRPVLMREERPSAGRPGAELKLSPDR
jgi:plastocyanin